MFPRRALSQIEQARVEWARRHAQDPVRRQFGEGRKPRAMQEQSLAQGTAVAMTMGRVYDPRVARTLVRQQRVVQTRGGWGLAGARPITSRAVRHR